MGKGKMKALRLSSATCPKVPSTSGEITPTWSLHTACRGNATSYDKVTGMELWLKDHL